MIDAIDHMLYPYPRPTVQVDLLMLGKLWRYLNDNGDASDKHYPIFGLNITALDMPLMVARMGDEGLVWIVSFSFYMSRGTNVEFISYPSELLKSEDFRLISFQGSKETFEADMVKARLVV